MRRSRQSRSSGRQQALGDLFPPGALEGEPVSLGPDSSFPLRPFADEIPRDAGVDPHVEAAETPAERLLRLGREAARMTRRGDALAAFQQLLELHPEHLVGRLELAQLHERDGDLEDALARARRGGTALPGPRRAARCPRGVPGPAQAASGGGGRPAAGHPAGAPSCPTPISNSALRSGGRGSRWTPRITCAGRSRSTRSGPPPITTSGSRCTRWVMMPARWCRWSGPRRSIPATPKPFQLMGRVLDRLGRPDEAREMYRRARETGTR